ncbi:ATP-binding cassette transporter snq2, partial [Linderina pennispora]
MVAHPESYQDEFLDALLDMYGLKPCADTIVGNTFLRGVSGGERKRVSIAEQIASGASVNVWDGSTRGLDSSSALDYVRSLRIGSDLLHKSTVVTIYQASENIYNLFDKVMVIDEGRQLYFGPADKAVQYFESIGIKKPPRQTTSDFLTGVTQTNERKLMPGFENKAPTTAEDFEHLWLASKERAELQSQISAFEQRLAEDDRGNEIRQLANRIKMGTEKSKMRKKSPYTTTFIYQLNHCMRREWGIFLGNRAAIYFKLIYNVAFAIIIGTLFIRLPQSTAGAFSRGGVLFFSLLFTTLTAQSEIPKAVSGREVVYKHKALAMYHPGALSLAQTLVDLPFATFQVLIFGTIVYWASAMERTGGHYLAAMVTLLVGCLCLTAFFRLIGNIAPYVDFGHTMSGIALLYMTLYVGYLIPPTKMHRYMVWAYWANPLAYGFKALLCNEFKDRMMRCSERDLIPNGPGFNIANQVCALKGSIPGQRYVSGRRYIEDAYDFHAKDQWKNFVAVVAFWLLFVVAIACVMEWVEYGNTGYSINVFKRYPPKVDALQDVNERVALAATEFGDVDSELGPTDDQLLKGTTYTWKHVNYTVPVSGGERMLLDDVSGYVKPGTMTALMGSSGA